MWDLANNLQLFHCYFIDLIQCINTWNILTVSFDHIYQIIHICVATNNYITVGDPVFIANSFDLKYGK